MEGYRQDGHRSVMDIPDSNGAYISYVAPGKSPALVQSLDAMLGVDASEGETALCVPGGGSYTFLILKGDWRARYADVVVKRGLQGCLDLFRDSQAFLFETSDLLEDLPS